MVRRAPDNRKPSAEAVGAPYLSEAFGCGFWFTPLRIPFFWARGFQFSADVGTEAAIRPPLEAKFFQMRYIVEPAHDQLVAFDNNPAQSSRG